MTRKRPATLAHVAAVTGLSVATVSRGLRGVGRMNEGTRARINQAAIDIGYRPNLGARALRQTTTPLVGFVADPDRYGSEDDPKLLWPLSDVALGNTLNAEGVALARVSAQQPELLWQLPIGAVISTHVQGKPILPPEGPQGIPVFLSAATPQPNEKFGAIYHDYRQACLDVCTHLISQGSRRLALVIGGDFPEPQGIVKETFLHQANTATTAGCAYAVDEETRLSDALTAAVQAGADAIFAYVGRSEETVNILTEMQVSIPRDVRLVCQGEGVLERLLQPSVTTLSYQAAQTGEIVAQEVQQSLLTGDVHDILCPHTLQIRDSSS